LRNPFFFPFSFWIFPPLFLFFLSPSLFILLELRGKNGDVEKRGFPFPFLFFHQIFYLFSVGEGEKRGFSFRPSTSFSYPPLYWGGEGKKKKKIISPDTATFISHSLSFFLAIQ